MQKGYKKQVSGILLPMSAEIIGFPVPKQPDKSCASEGEKDNVVSFQEKVNQSLTTGDYVLPFVENTNKQEILIKLFEILKRTYINSLVKIKQTEDTLFYHRIPDENEEETIEGMKERFFTTFENGEWKVLEKEEDGTLILVHPSNQETFNFLDLRLKITPENLKLIIKYIPSQNSI